GSTLRNLGRTAEAAAQLERAEREFPGRPSVTAFLARALPSAGRGAEAVARRLLLVLDRVEDEGLRRYAAALRGYAGQLQDAPRP
ncbi:MAG: tetratricopeptide repeat protein, partial [Trebonia sp.]